MTIKKRLFISSIIMIAVPVFSALMAGLLCIAVILLAVINGSILGLDGQDDFNRACMAVSEIAEKEIENKSFNFSYLNSLLDNNGISMKIISKNKEIYSYGNVEFNNNSLLDAASLLGSESTVTADGQSLFYSKITENKNDYSIYILGGNSNKQIFSTLKVSIVISALIVTLTVIFTVLLTNRFLTKFIFKRIEEPIEIIYDGVRELSDGNLDYRIEYKKSDEFLSVCSDFNKMADYLKDSSENMLKQEKMRKELIAGISHDLRTPLTSIKAYVEGLLDGIAKTPEMQKKYLTTILNKADSIDNMISQMSLLSKMELGEYPENLCDVRLDEKIRETINDVEDEYAEQGLNISTELCPVSVCADPLQIRRIVINILENSLKYKDKENVQVVIALNKDKYNFLWTFDDNGPGVSDDALDRLFETFYRSDDARQNPDNGSGLGLSIVANAAERIGGSIKAEHSKLGGLRIRIDLNSAVTKNEKNIDN